MTSVCAQTIINKETPEPNLTKDSIGRVLTNSNSRLLLFISTDQSGKDAVKLTKNDNTLSPLEIKNQGRHRIIFFDSNKNQSQTYYFFVDNEPPVSSFESDSNFIISNDTISASSGFRFSIKNSDNISGIKRTFYALNGGGFKIYDNPLVFDEEKKYNLKFYSEDLVGNKETQKEYTIVIDNTPPITELSIIQDYHENIVSKRSLFNLAPKDVHGIKETWFWFNDEKPSLYRKPVETSKLSEGPHEISYYSIDRLGNKEDINTFEFYLDNTPPIIFEEILGNKFIRGGREYSSGRSQLRITAIDNKAGVKEIHYSFDGKNFTLYEGPVFLSMVSGNITISSYALDNVNNKSYSSAKGTSIAIPYVDLNAPQISHSIKGASILLRDTLFISPRTQIVVNAVDHESGLNRIIYRISNFPETEYKAPFNITEQGFHQVYYTAFDNVDNANTDSFKAYVDTTGPEINIEYSIKSYKTTTIEGLKLPVFPQHLKIFATSKDIHTGADKISYILNSGKEQEYKGAISSFQKNAINTLVILSIDVLGNKSEKEIQFFVE
jgi:hypothetical protein